MQISHHFTEKPVAFNYISYNAFQVFACLWDDLYLHACSPFLDTVTGKCIHESIYIMFITRQSILLVKVRRAIDSIWGKHIWEMKKRGLLQFY